MSRSALTRAASPHPSDAKNQQPRAPSPPGLAGHARAQAALRLGALCALSASLPSTALAQRGGGRLTFVLLAAPMIVPLLGLLLAVFGLRLTRARGFWRFLCGLLGLNSALLGALFALVEGDAMRVTFLFGQLCMAGAMLFTLPRDVSEPRAKLVLARVWSVAVCAVLPGLATKLLLQWLT